MRATPGAALTAVHQLDADVLAVTGVVATLDPTNWVLLTLDQKVEGSNPSSPANVNR